MNKKLKSSPSYKQGWNDADILVKTGLSVWALYSLSHAWGFRRKSKGSHKKLFRYCEGFGDRLAKLAKAKGIKTVQNEWMAEEPSQNDIGK